VSRAEFSRVVRVDDLPPGGTAMTVTADAAECAALAARFDLLALRGLKAMLELTPGSAGGGRTLHVAGRLTAEVEQACVVTLDPVPSRVDEPVDLSFAEAVEPAAAEAVVAVDAEDPPEPMADGAVDLGEAVAELLALALEPYPRKPGAVFEPLPEPAAAAASPFAALRQIKGKH
jgi:uncharacterized metal-binding protein YceD (DUF177 family)